MGVYLYGVKKSNPVKAVFGDQRVSVHKLQYITKPRWSVFEEELNPLAKRIVGRIQSAWGEQLPEYVALIDKDEKGKENFVGAAVYRNPPSVLWYDSEKIADEMVGYLFRGKKGNVILPVAEAEQIVREVTGLQTIESLMGIRPLRVNYAHPRASMVIDLYLRLRGFCSPNDIVDRNEMVFVA